MIENLSVYSRPKVLAIFLLGISSGLPFALVSSTLKIWLTEVGISIQVIGVFSIVTLPYTLKFLWAPFIDYFSFPYLAKILGRRRSWLLVTQILLAISIVILGYSDPSLDIIHTGICAFIVVFCSATQDVIVDAYRIELLSKEEQSYGAAMFVFGYRMGMLITGAGALYISEYFDWSMTYGLSTIGIAIGMFVVLSLGEKPMDKTLVKIMNSDKISFLKKVIINPFVEMVKRSDGVIIILFVLCYKLGDSLLFSITGPFLVNIGFSKAEIATIAKFWGLIATVFGSMIGGILIYSIGIRKSLWIGAIIQASSNFMYCLQSIIGYDTHFLAITIGIENLSGGLSTAVFIAYLGNLCNKVQYTATQYALYTALSAVGRDILSIPTGYLIEQIGWIAFFALTILISIPGMAFLYLLTKRKTLCVN
ncbi:MAG: AmpG family muropeptide MFS transporter [Rickettsiales endosymbiont of Dermacentor nuttalli]